ncbi:MAG: hypothetical protein HKN62_00645 [Phycisphaerales bacterium]|nr:hypothetical protein [Phycisphaerales bacterium]
MEGLSEIPLPALMAAGAFAVAMLIGLLSRLQWAYVIVGVMFFLASLGVARKWWGGVQALWLYPAQSNRSALYVTAGSLLIVSVIGHLHRMRFGSLPSQGFVLLVMALYAALMRFVQESPADGAASIAFTLCTILPLLLVVPALLAEWEDWTTLIRTLAITNLGWVGAVAVQFAINPAQLTIDRSARFVGLTGNPQHAGVYLAVTATIALWLLLNDHKQRYRLLWMGLLGLNGILLAWTGSRTGMGMFVIGLTGVLYSRVGRSILYLPVVVFALAGAYQLMMALGVDLGLERLASTQNTRSEAWSKLISNGLSSPLFGVGISEAGDSENSYLYGFAAYGLGMVVLTGLLVAVSARVVWKLFWVRRYVEPYQRALIDLIIAYIGMYFAGALFEGYIMARVAANLVLFLVFSSMASRLLAQVQEEQAWAAEQEWDEHAESAEWDADGEEAYEEDDDFGAYEPAAEY